VNAITCGECGTLLYSCAAVFNCFGVSSSKIMGGGKTGVENRILWVVRAHTDRLLQMGNCLIRLAVECERPAEVAVGGCEVRVESDCAPEFRRCHAGLSPRKRRVA